MGVSDFYDVDAVDPEDERPNKDTFVREVIGDDYEVERNLTRAMDGFVLSGALKLFRHEKGIAVRQLQHHTMLVHLSSMRADHKREAEAIKTLFEEARYRPGGKGYNRLQKLYAEDFLPITKKLDGDAPRPRTFSDLDRHIAEAKGRIAKTGNPVAMVNSDKEYLRRCSSTKIRSGDTIVGGQRKFSVGEDDIWRSEVNEVTGRQAWMDRPATADGQVSRLSARLLDLAGVRRSAAREVIKQNVARF